MWFSTIFPKQINSQVQSKSDNGLFKTNFVAQWIESRKERETTVALFFRYNFYLKCLSSMSLIFSFSFCRACIFCRRILWQIICGPFSAEHASILCMCVSGISISPIKNFSHKFYPFSTRFFPSILRISPSRTKMVKRMESRRWGPKRMGN